MSAEESRREQRRQRIIAQGIANALGDQHATKAARLMTQVLLDLATERDPLKIRRKQRSVLDVFGLPGERIHPPVGSPTYDPLSLGR